MGAKWKISHFLKTKEIKLYAIIKIKDICLRIENTRIEVPNLTSYI